MTKAKSKNNPKIKSITIVIEEEVRVGDYLKATESDYFYDDNDNEIHFEKNDIGIITNIFAKDYVGTGEYSLFINNKTVRGYGEEALFKKIECKETELSIKELENLIKLKKDLLAKKNKNKRIKNVTK